MENSVSRPDTVNKLRFAADSAFAMLAGMQLDVFTPLQNGPMTAEEIAGAIGIGASRLRLLLYSLVPAGLLIEKDGRFSNTPEANQFLVNGARSYVGHMHTVLSHRWMINLKTAESIRTGVPQAKLDFSNSPQEEIEAFLRTINRRTVSAAHGLLERYDFSSAGNALSKRTPGVSRISLIWLNPSSALPDATASGVVVAVNTLADVGSGSGGLAISMAKFCPHMQATAVDLPLVTPITQKIVAEEGMTDRVKVIEADVVRDPVPGSYDVAVLRGLLQVLSSEDARRAVKNIYTALKSGGRIYIVGQILDDSRISPAEAVGFNLTFISTYDAGESYTEQEHRDWLREAGFADVERTRFLLADNLGIMTARKPK
jgi:SAM-dependent methyltransferase